uniref:Uncharacterized protein n=1 Tax=Arundo donax TaxID=35708 RepID=A0A0A8ZKJ4_ARUDO
MEAGGGLGA